jgi:hypothetical protein
LAEDEELSTLRRMLDEVDRPSKHLTELCRVNARAEGTVRRILARPRASELQNDAALRGRAAAFLAELVEHAPSPRLVDLGALALGVVQRVPAPAVATVWSIPRTIIDDLSWREVERVARDNEPLAGAEAEVPARTALAAVLLGALLKQLSYSRWAEAPERPAATAAGQRPSGLVHER